MENNLHSTAPCKGCTDRKLGCHDKCKKYIKFKKENNERRKKEFINTRSGWYY